VESFSLKALNDQGNLLFAFLIVWAYMVWFQFMLIWMANLPLDLIWYVPRSYGVWPWVTGVLVVFHFLIPLLLLLFRSIKQVPHAMARIAGLLLMMQLLFCYYLVMPTYQPLSLAHHWMDVLMPVAIGGIWFAHLLWQLEGRPLLAQYDTNEAEAVHLRHKDEAEARREEAPAHG
jgi:hypothetical protein